MYLNMLKISAGIHGSHVDVYLISKRRDCFFSMYNLYMVDVQCLFETAIALLTFALQFV